jgi:pyruvate/2-oxoglutarate dehydrogenase complex dihydrolipoamide dehydrogenase (E3) component
VESFDIAVLGGGTAGLTAARIAAAAGRRVALIETARLGGECTWTGCVPSKALIEVARIYHEMKRSPDFGIQPGDVRVDFGTVMRRVHDTILQIASFEDAAHLETKGIVVVPGSGRFLDGTTLDVGGRSLRAPRIILCTGSRPSVPDIPGLRDGPYLTNETLFDLERRPERLIVVGAGATGLEMGQAFCRLGSDVAMLDVEQTFLPREDPDVAGRAREALEREGIRFLLGVWIERIDWRGESVQVMARLAQRSVTLEGDSLLLAVGRRPAVDGLELEKIGVKLDRHGLQVDRHMRTSVGSVYAAGDVTGIYQFTHMAAYQARVAAQSALGRRTKADYRVVPWVIFTDPEIAHVGLTEPEARNQYGNRIRAVVLPYSAIDKAVIDHNTEGMIKLVVGRKPVVGFLGGGELIGAHIYGTGAGQMLHEFVLSMQTRAFAGRLAQTIHAYPTMSTGVQQAAGLLFPVGQATIDLREELKL